MAPQLAGTASYDAKYGNILGADSQKRTLKHIWGKKGFRAHSRLDPFTYHAGLQTCQVGESDILCG